MGTLASLLRQLQRRTEQLSTLHQAEQAAAIGIDKLERVLDFDRVASHVRTRVARAELAETPLPHLCIADVLPDDVYGALVAAIPAAVFFDGGVDHGAALRIPPRLAPSCSIVTWGFITEIVLQVLSPALVRRFQDPLAAFAKTRFPDLPPFGEWNVEITLSEGRIVRRLPGYAGAAGPHREWDFLTTVLCLARQDDDERFGSRVGGLSFPCLANSALTFLGSGDAHEYAPIPPTAPAGTERHTYEFGTGPTREGRRALAPMRTGAV